MSIRTQSFYRAEKRLYLGAIICGFAFLSLYFWTSGVSEIYYYLFHTLAAYGLIYLISYITKYQSLNSCYQRVTKKEGDTQSLEHDWIQNRLKECGFNRILQTGVLFMGLGAMIIAFGGFFKTILGGTGAGLMLGSGVWLAIELISQLQSREYQQFLKKK